MYIYSSLSRSRLSIPVCADKQAFVFVKDTVLHVEDKLEGRKQFTGRVTDIVNQSYELGQK